MKKSSKIVWFFVGVLFLIQVGGGYVLYLLTAKVTPVPELLMGTLTVFSITTLMTVLFIVAAGFSSMKLTNPRQALGLPEGSIRAMIALVLLMVFILISIYLFRKVSVPDMTYMGSVRDISDVRTDSTKTAVIFEPIPEEEKENKSNYYVYTLSEISEEGKRLAQQLITILGTLVTAISSFYFGNSITRSAGKKARDEILASQGSNYEISPVIIDVVPKQGEKGKEVTLEIMGTGFITPKEVCLIRNNEVMTCTNILSNSSKIQCNVKIDKEVDGKWDIKVTNADDTEISIQEVFSIIDQKNTII